MDMFGASISLTDNMSQPLNQIAYSAQQSANSMSQLKQATEQSFDSTPMSNYANEINRVNEALNRMQMSQRNIAESAASTGLFSESQLSQIQMASDDLSRLQQKLQVISQDGGYINLDTKQAQHSFDSINQKIQEAERLQQELNQAAQSHDISGAMTSYDNLKHKISDAGNELSSLQQHMQQIPNIQDPPTDGFEQYNNQLISTGGLLRKLGSIAAKVAPMLALGNILKSGFDRLTSIDNAQAKLYGLGHSAQSVEAIMDDALASVKGTAFGMDEAVNTAASAVAAGIAPGQQLERYLTLVGDSAAIAGTDMQSMGAIFNKVTTSNVMRTEEMNQMLDRGIPIIQMLAEEMGVAEDQVRGLASEGAISADTFLNAIEGGFGGAAKVMGELSFQATIDNIGASLARMGANFLNGGKQGQGFFDQVKPLMVDLLNWMNSVEDKVAVLGAMFGKAFSVIANVIGTAFKIIASQWDWLKYIVYGLLTLIGLYTVVLGIYKTYTLLSAAATKMLATAQGMFNGALWASPITWYVIAVVALVAAYYAVVAAVNKWLGTSLNATGMLAGAVMWLGSVILNIGIFVANALIAAVEIIVNVFLLGVWAIQFAWHAFIIFILAIVDIIVNVFATAIELIVNFWNLLVYTVQLLWVGFITFILAVLDVIINGVIGMAENVTNTWNDMVYGLQSAFYEFQQMAGGVFQAVAQGAYGVVNSALSGISSLINAAIGGLNKLIGMANKIPKVNIPTIGEVNFSAGSAPNIGARFSGGPAPKKPKSVSFGRSQMASNYLSGVNMPSALETFKLDRSSLAADYSSQVEIKPFEPKQFDRIEYTDPMEAFNKGYKWGEGLGDKLSGKSLGEKALEKTGLEGLVDELAGETDGSGAGNGSGGRSGSGGGNKALKGIGKDVKDINKKTGASEEDLRYLRDLARREAINRFTTAEVSVNMGGITNNVSNKDDIDGIIDYLTGGIEEAINITVEGVHES